MVLQLPVGNKPREEELEDTQRDTYTKTETVMEERTRIGGKL